MKKINDQNITKLIRPGARIFLISILAGLLLFPHASYMAGTAAGDLDPTFGMDGKVKTDFFGHRDEARAIALQTDNKIVAVGTVTEPTFGTSDFGLARYHADGSLDLSFGSGGKVITDVQGGDEGAEDVAIQPDGKIVVAGHNDSPFTLTGGVFVIARYLPNGSLDPAFGSGGIVRTSFSSSSVAALAIALQPDGKIVAAGGGVLNNEPGGGAFNVSAMARYNPDGSLDQTFGSGGKVLPAANLIFDLALQADGKIVAVAGFSFTVLRFNPDGSPDSTFGSAGKVDHSILGGAILSSLGVALQTNGKIVIVGSSSSLSNSNVDFGLVRLNTNGSPDTTFGMSGVAITDLGNYEAAWDVAIQPDEKIVVSGESNKRFAVARFTSTGSLDNTFNVLALDFGCGNTSPPSSSPSSVAYSVALYPDGKVIAGGTSCSPRDFVLARYNGDSFDLCLQDESNSKLLKLNSTTGDYQFIECGTGFTLGGRGTIINRGNQLLLQISASDRRVMVSIDRGANRGTASVQVFSPAKSFSIIDKNLGNNSCACS
jgi:uncharacterized delta-60 repeat protein